VNRNPTIKTGAQMKNILPWPFRFLIVLFALAASNVFAQVISLPNVSIRVTDSTASEPGTDTGTFSVYRSSFTNQPLTVYFEISGTASNGVDYVALPIVTGNTGSVTIPAGATNATVKITPIDDTILELTETVTLTLRQVLASSQNWTYNITSPSVATIYILDNETNLPPTVSLVNPTNGASFTSPVNILLQAQASDSDGSIARVYFLSSGTNVLGSGVLDGGLYNFVWTNPPPGNFTLTARVFDNLEGRSTSAPVNITITGTTTDIPMVTVTASDSEASEPGSNTGTFTFYRRGSTNNSVTVFCVIGGTASNGVDYVQLSNWVTIPAGLVYTNVIVKPIDDTLVEGTETVSLTLSYPPTEQPVNYSIGSPSNAVVNILDNDTHETNVPPTVHLLSPTNNAVFITPTNITIYATASDTNGWITTVEFFAGTHSLGVVTNNPLSTSPVNPYYILWTNVAAGSYVLTAVATDNGGATTTSEPVNITVQEGPTIPTVKIVATDSSASESATTSNPGTSNNTGTFTVSRSGFTNSDLLVSYEIGGTASNGSDYVSISDSVTIPAGFFYTAIKITPIDDTLVEGTETVVLTLRTNDHYLLGDSHSATVYIEDNDHITNASPTVQITSPTNGSVFTGPTNILITADASDSDGNVVKVDFYAGDHLVGTSSNAPYSAGWSNALSGSYSLIAKAMDNLGETGYSKPVSVYIKSAYELTFVKRTLPIWYVPGVKLIVRLNASPRTNTLVWSASDVPPTNWVVGAVSEGGAYDPTTGKVNFGPFTTKLTRALTYEVTPPSTETGTKYFTGTATADGVNSPVGGAGSILQVPPHPADNNPIDFSMTLDEVGAYSNAWKHGSLWPIGPNPVPISYLTRAGFLYESSSSYTISTVYPTPFPPLLWVPVNSKFPPITGSSSLSGDFPYVTNYSSLAVSSLPTNYFWGVPFTVTITVTPPTNTLAYAGEDRPPVGFVVTNISDDGVFCPVTKKVNWGVYLDNTPRVLTYQVIPPTNITGLATFSGTASFDGRNVPVTRQRYTRFGGGTLPPLPQSVTRLANGDRLLTFIGTPGVAYRIEVSTDLLNWTPLEQLLNNDGILHYTDTASTDFVNRFYRVVPIQ